MNSTPPAPNMSSAPPPSPAPGDRAQIRQWQLLVDELNRLNAQLEYLKLMLKLDQMLRRPGD
ncbi:MAG: hypothetical protein KIT35_01290 [Piscinibacter sp.]|uniref:hypothetical protein n=1 Tax=Piscinibacter sp. TaxID=1903157 RepID=UPI002582F53D|nr:hypothetical protein [Piscinibacter sp.]MCW5662441.1 hypothetical protein [Piscinibacter sp.]